MQTSLPTSQHARTYLLSSQWASCQNNKNMNLSVPQRHILKHRLIQITGLNKAAGLFLLFYFYPFLQLNLVMKLAPEIWESVTGIQKSNTEIQRENRQTSLDVGCTDTRMHKSKLPRSWGTAKYIQLQNTLKVMLTKLLPTVQKNFSIASCPLCLWNTPNLSVTAPPWFPVIIMTNPGWRWSSGWSHLRHDGAAS